MKKWEIWMEGYAMNCESAKASLVEEVEAETFEEACQILVKRRKWEYLYNPESNTVWCCRLFDNEIDARKSFG